MKKLFPFYLVVFLTISSAIFAQEAEDTTAIDYIPEISLDTRFGFNQSITDKSGRFYSDGIYLNLSGNISPHFSYTSNIKFLSPEYGSSICWLLLTYERDWFSVSAGKDAIYVGGFEYDAMEIDTYFDMSSLFYNSFDCWQWGASAAFCPAEGHSILLQVANSPLTYDPNHFAYALAWRSEYDWYESYWSVNLWQYDKGAFVKALNLGNKFHIGDFSLVLDYMTRSYELNTLFTEDFTALAMPSYEGCSWCRPFLKVGFERASEILEYDFVGDNLFYGVGAEFFPIRNYKELRLFATWTHNTEYTQSHQINIGATWRIDLTKALRK